MTENGRLPDLPQSWVWVKLGDMIEKVTLTGRKLKQSDYQGEGRVPVIDQGQSFVGGYTNRQDLVVPCELPVVVFGDHTKAVKYVDFEFVAGADGIKVLQPGKAFYPKLFYYFLRAIPLPDKGYARHFQFLEKSFVPLPPFAEQQRIVAKIEELFTQLDAGVAALEQAKIQLRRYRQAVLKAAVEGELTREWREAHRGEVEPASVLLERMLEERWAKWEAENPGKRYEPPDPPNIEDLPQLPAEWRWATLEQISWDSGYGTSMKCDYDLSGPPVLRIPNISDGDVALSDLKYASDPSKLGTDAALAPGDLLIIRTNGSKDLIGRAALVKTQFDRPHFFASYLIRYRILDIGTLPGWCSSIWHSPRVRAWIMSVAATTAGQYNVSVGKLNKLSLELPPLAEQQRIIDELERCLSTADELEKAVEQGLRRAERLRQSILKRAFEGKLVPQEPGGEPASALLERIRAEKGRGEVVRAERGRREKKQPRQLKLL